MIFHFSQIFRRPVGLLLTVFQLSSFLSKWVSSSLAARLDRSLVHWTKHCYNLFNYSRLWSISNHSNYNLCFSGWMRSVFFSLEVFSILTSPSRPLTPRDPSTGFKFLFDHKFVVTLWISFRFRNYRFYIHYSNQVLYLARHLTLHLLIWTLY